MNIRNLYLSLSVIALSGASYADTAPKSTYDWTGVYVGGYVGGASGANATSSVAHGVSINNAPSPDWASGSSSNYSTSASFMGGGTVGYNWQIPKTAFLIGLEGEYGYLGSSGSSQNQDTPGYGFSVSTQNKTTIGSDYGYGLVGGRLGYALDRSLFYVKSGAVFTQVKSTQTTITDTQHNYLPEDFTSPTTNSGGTTTGYAIGGGVEYAPSWYSNENFTVKVEYLYFGIPTSNNANNVATETYYPLTTAPQTYQNSTGGISTAKIGVNYKF